MRWRWDQGRLEYFRFDNIRRIACSLHELDGATLKGGDSLRSPMEDQTGLAFLPSSYSVWRNYGRTFQCALLATKIGNILRTTDICKRLADDGDNALGSDEYFTIIMRQFYLPFPAFTDYQTSGSQVFPFCAVMRFLLSKAVANQEPRVSLDEIFSFVVGNECKGNEPISFYSGLHPTGHTATGDERRQVREMLIAISQFSYLDWVNNNLELDVATEEKQTITLLESQFMPSIHERLPHRGEEILHLGTLTEHPDITLPQRETAADIVFTEGKRVRMTHLRIERNRKIRKEFFERMEPPFRCDVCGILVNERYPWVDNLLQVHHILPLSSPIYIGGDGTSFSDIVALCPNCHGAIHRYYRSWLSSHNQVDFLGNEEAHQVYEGAKREYAPD